MTPADESVLCTTGHFMALVVAVDTLLAPYCVLLNGISDLCWVWPPTLAFPVVIRETKLDATVWGYFTLLNRMLESALGRCLLNSNTIVYWCQYCCMQEM